MPLDTIADSNAFRDDSHLLPQHQAALTLLQSLLTEPNAAKICWLDLACGRGQMIIHLDQNLSEKARSKLAYYGYDTNVDFTRQASKAVARMNLKTTDFKVGALVDFSTWIPEICFDFVTIINTIHEINPSQLACILIHSLTRLAPRGCLFVYDMESLDPLELGAITWTQEEMSSIVQSICNDIASNKYEPEVSRWRHRTTQAWSFSIHRAYLNVDHETLIRSTERTIAIASKTVNHLLLQKLERCRKTLESLTMHGCETVEEEKDRQKLLYDFWALNRTVEVE